MKKLILISNLSITVFAFDADLERARVASLKTFEAEQLQRALVESTKDFKKTETVKTLKVLQQSGADCFFHALKNGMYVYNWQTGKINEQECIKNINSSDSTVFPLEQWRKITTDKFKQSTNLDDLAGQHLVKEAKLTENDCTIISNLFELVEFTKQKDQHLSILDINLDNLIKDFRTSANKVHMFILGNMRHTSNSSGKLSSTMGHWISVVACKKNNQLTYYVMDSLSGNNSEITKQFAYLIEESKLF